MFGDRTGLTLPEFLIFAMCMVGGGFIVAGVGIQWGVGAELIAIGAYTIISGLAYFGVIERKKSIVEFETKRKQSEAKQEKASSRYEEMRAQNAAAFDEAKREMDSMWRKP